MVNIADGNTYVVGRDIEQVRRLLAIAEEIGLDPAVVQTRNGGYEVPNAVAEVYEKEQADAEKSSAPKASARKTPAAKGTRSKKAASE